MRNYRITYLHETIHLNQWVKVESAFKPIFKAQDPFSALNKFYKQKDEYGYNHNKFIPKSDIIKIEVV